MLNRANNISRYCSSRLSFVRVARDAGAVRTEHMYGVATTRGVASSRYAELRRNRPLRAGTTQRPASRKALKALITRGTLYIRELMGWTTPRSVSDRT